MSDEHVWCKQQILKYSDGSEKIINYRLTPDMSEEIENTEVVESAEVAEVETVETPVETSDVEGTVNVEVSADSVEGTV